MIVKKKTKEKKKSETKKNQDIKDTRKIKYIKKDLKDSKHDEKQNKLVSEKKITEIKNDDSKADDKTGWWS